MFCSGDQNRRSERGMRDEEGERVTQLLFFLYMEMVKLYEYGRN